MCWSFAASIIFTFLGIIGSIYLIWKKDDKYLWIPLIYFSLMELLQVFSYIYIDKCSLPANQMVTYLSYLHIAFQPFFINMVFMHFIPTATRRRIEGYVYAICFAAAIMMIVRAYPFTWATPCNPTTPLCGKGLCAISGNWHLGWLLPIKNFGMIFELSYLFAGFIIPFIYGAWKVNIYHIFAGPILARLLTSNIHEFPAIWCLFSVAMFFIIFIPGLRKHFYSKKWYFWKYPFKK